MLAVQHAVPMPAGLPLAEQMTWSLPDPSGDDRRWRRKRFAMLPQHFGVAVATCYLETHEERGAREANLYLLHLTDQIEQLVLRPTASDGDIVALAKETARKVSDHLRRAACWADQRRGYVAPTLRTLLALCRRYGIAPPLGIGDDETDPDRIMGAIRRLTCELWWRRRLRCIHGRVIEALEIRAHQVHWHASPYVSLDTLQRYMAQKRRNTLTLQSLFAQNEDGDEFSLAELAEKSTANPAIRRGELMTRLAGFDQLSQALGHIGLFLTLTCPSCMHSTHKQSGKPNPHYDGQTTPREAQQYLLKLWTQIRAKFHRQSIRPYGFRVAEPHHDGTTHWHLLLFIEPAKADALIGIMRDYALRLNPDEPGAQQRRLECIYINRAEGSAVGYIAKYIAKNTDGYGMEREGEGDGDGNGNGNGNGNHRDTAPRAVAWASTWGIRQFQQIGGPSVSVWRELRRLRTALPGGATLEHCRAAADVGDWARYVQLMGGPQARRDAQAVRLAKRHVERAGRYGDPIAPQIVGVQCGELIQLTRVHAWKIMQRRTLPPQQGERYETPQFVAAEEVPIATILLGPLPSDLPPDNGPSWAGVVSKAVGRAAWSSVNNCTHQAERCWQ